MVKYIEAYEMADSDKLNSLSKVGVEIVGKDSISTCNASEIFPENGERVVVFVYLRKNGKGAPYEYTCVEKHPTFVSDLIGIDGLNDFDKDNGANIVIRIIDDDTHEVLKEYEPSAVWENTERDEMTFTVRI